MPPAARLNDPATHMAKPITPGIGSNDVEIGYMRAWRALPTGMGDGVETALKTMKELMDSPLLDPATTPIKLAKVNQGLMSDAGKAASNGAPAAPGAVSGGFTTLMSTNVALTATYTAAAAVPGGEPAARTAYTQGIKAAAAAFASSAMSAIAGMTDIHVCPQPSGPIPHGPGVVTKGSKSVWFNHLPACRETDQIFEAAGGPDPIKKGCPSVLIGDDGGPPEPEPETVIDDEAIEKEMHAQSSIAALNQAAAAGIPLIEVCPQCAKLREAVQKIKHKLVLCVVDDGTGEPIAGVTLRVTLPDGQQEMHTTDAQGRVEIDDLEEPGDCSVTCDLQGAQLAHTYGFVRMGEA